MIDLSSCSTTEECLQQSDTWLSSSNRTMADVDTCREAIFSQTKELIRIVHSALGILVNSEHEILLLKRNANARSFPGVFSFPGGQYDPQDADLAETAVRETLEETGLKTRALRLHSTRFTTEYQRKRIFHMEFWLLSCSDVTQNIELSDEHSEYVWALPQDILANSRNYPLAGEIILQEVIQGLIEII
ncbi:MAG: hypothetical protein JWM56_1327 [Candidatus Peribacteria bacterium]|nr:hypothetical protein [Candidatus Peribacteria bacterium]